MTGVGKTWRSARDIEAYFQLKRKVLIFDTNMEADYAAYPTVYFDVSIEDELQSVREVLRFSNQKEAEIRRVIPFLPNGRPMERDEKARTALMILKHFHGGLLVLEDYNAYFSTSRSGAFISSITTNRHRRQDILIHVQSLRKVDSSLGENVTYLRLHKQVDPVDSYADKFPNAALITVGTLVVDKQYNEGNRRYFCYANVRDNKLIGVSQADFEDAARRYLQANRKLISNLLLWEDDQGRKMYPTVGAAMNQWIAERSSWLAE